MGYETKYVPFDELLAQMRVKVPSFEEYDDGTFSYVYGASIADGLDEDEATEKALDAESVVQDELYTKWRNSAENALEAVFDEHGLMLSFDHNKGTVTISPRSTWRTSARHIVDTINGVGQFEFLDEDELCSSVPCNMRQAVLSHVHWIRYWPAVYGGRSLDDRINR